MNTLKFKPDSLRWISALCLLPLLYANAPAQGMLISRTLYKGALIEPKAQEASLLSIDHDSFGYDNEMTDPSRLIYLQSRFYNEKGEFIREDSFGNNTFNRYTAFSADAVNRVDPMGSKSKMKDFLEGEVNTEKEKGVLKGLLTLASFVVRVTADSVREQIQDTGQLFTPTRWGKFFHDRASGGVLIGVVPLFLLPPALGSPDRIAEVAEDFIKVERLYEEDRGRGEIELQALDQKQENPHLDNILEPEEEEKKIFNEPEDAHPKRWTLEEIDKAKGSGIFLNNFNEPMLVASELQEEKCLGLDPHSGLEALKCELISKY